MTKFSRNAQHNYRIFWYPPEELEKSFYERKPLESNSIASNVGRAVEKFVIEELGPKNLRRSDILILAVLPEDFDANT